MKIFYSPMFFLFFCSAAAFLLKWREKSNCIDDIARLCFKESIPGLLCQLQILRTDCPETGGPTIKSE